MGAALAAWPLWRQRRAVALLTAAGTAAIFLVPWLAGARESNLAYNECVQDGERVREDLAEYRDRNGRFPEQLSALPAHLPGKLLLPPHLFDYRRTPTGYALAFSDRLVEQLATEREGFLAHK